uniref:Putative nuclease HARBI1 n=1 Tax=Diabrotica virgifera virgifera TaxID=50390 RepID=A0A6P7FE40_DIAVI
MRQVQVKLLEYNKSAYLCCMDLKKEFDIHQLKDLWNTSGAHHITETVDILYNAGFRNFFRMTTTDFQTLLDLIGPVISRKDTSFRAAIPASERLAVTLRFFASGDSYHSLMYTFKISKQTISKCVAEVCKALIDALQDYVKMTKTNESWYFIAKQFNDKWNFPNCVGAMDGKHISIQAPINSGTDFFNYKSFFSIVLFAVVDANYNFIYANVGCQGRISDGGVFNDSYF